MFRVIMSSFCVAFRVAPLVRHLEPSLFQFGVRSRIFSLASKAVIYLQFDIQSCHLSLVRHPEPLVQFGHLESHFWQSELSVTLVSHSEQPLFSMAFRDTFSSQRSKPHLQSGVQSRCLFQFGIQSRIFFPFGVQSHTSNQAFRVVVYFQFGVQSRIFSLASESSFISSLTFRAIIPFSAWRSKPSFVFFQFDIQSRHVFLSFAVHSHVFILAFRAASLVWCSEPSFVLSLTFRATSFFWHSEPLFSLAFSATIFFQFWRSEPFFIPIKAFRVAILPSFWHSEPLFSSEYSVIIFLQFWHSEPLYILIQAF